MRHTASSKTSDLPERPFKEMPADEILWGLERHAVRKENCERTESFPIVSIGPVALDESRDLFS